METLEEQPQAVEQPVEQRTPEQVNKSLDTAMRASVKIWNARIKSAREHWKKDFIRMRENMDFCGGYQWAGQVVMNDDRYKSNLTLKLVQQKVASLYAKDPKIRAQRVRRMDFQLWDERMESLQQAAAVTTLPEAPPEEILVSRALLADYSKGRLQRDMVDKVGRTLEHVYTYFQKNQTPEFKTQMKQCVRRAVITGVGYVRLNFAREYEQTLSTTSSTLTMEERINRADEILARLKAGEITEESPEIVELGQLFEAAHADEAVESTDVQERLVFDFPMSTSIIVDKNCRSLKGFVGAKWIAQEYIMDLKDVNAFFKTNISYGVGSGSNLVKYDESGTDGSSPEAQATDHETEGCKVCLWEVFDQRTKSSFFIVDGYDKYLQEPAPLMPQSKHFWPIFALTFNDVEVEPGQTNVTIYPPSDVDLAKDAQKEWNRMRERLRDHRGASVPKWMTRKGVLTSDDIERITNSAANSVIQLEGVPPDFDLSKLFIPIANAPIDPLVYDTSNLTQDLYATIGNEENSAPASTKATATAATINEQSRIVTTSSNVDDLDDFLSAIAEAGGEILLRELSPETVLRIAGDGMVWPSVAPEDFVHHVFLEVIASSSGRPNKALEVSNFTQLAPILQAAGVNPHFLVREGIKRLDDRLDPDEIFTFGQGQATAAMSLPNANGGDQQQPEGVPGADTPASGEAAPTAEGQNPTATVPRPKTERPKV